MPNDYVRPTQQYRNVEFEWNRVNLLWNCCAIVKKLLELEQTVADVEHKQENIPDDVNEYFAEFETELHAATADIVAIKANITSLTSTVTGIANDIEGLNSDVDTLESDLNALASRVTQAENNLTQLQTDVSTLNTTVTGIGNRVTSLETQQTSQAGQLSTLNTTVTGLESDVDTLDDAVSTLTTVQTIPSPSVLGHDNAIATLVSFTGKRQGNVCSFNMVINVSDVNRTLDFDFCEIVGQFAGLLYDSPIDAFPARYYVTNPDDNRTYIGDVSLYKGISGSTKFIYFSGTNNVQMSISDADTLELSVSGTFLTVPSN